MTIFEGVIAVFVVVVPPVGIWVNRSFAKRDAGELRSATAKVAEVAAETAETAKRGQEIAEASRKEAAHEATKVAAAVETTRKEVAQAAAIVADVAKATAAQVETSAITTLKKLDTLATQAQLDGGLTKMLDKIREQIGEAYAKGHADGQRATVDAAVARIEATLAKQDGNKND